jgi:predicted nucleic-acid-binding protein
MQLIDTNVILRFLLKDNDEMSLDFVDCLLVAYHSLKGESVFTFDKKLNKHLSGDMPSV